MEAMIRVLMGITIVNIGITIGNFIIISKADSKIKAIKSSLDAAYTIMKNELLKSELR